MKQADKPIRIGGVPEHFNIPWHLAIEQGQFKAAGVDVAWKDYYGGTGAMTRELNHDQLDIAVLLTEGIVADIAKGGQNTILQFYVSSPLTWGVFVHGSSIIKSLDQLDTKRFAISRIGSGSHLMAQVFAREHDFELEPIKTYSVVGNLDGARSALAQDPFLLFLWEEFTTKHLVDRGTFNMIDTFETPWPCFAIAVRNKMLAEHPEAIQTILDVINKSARTFMDNRDMALAETQKRHDLSLEDATTWYNRTAWQGGVQVSKSALEKVVSHLHALEMIPQKPAVEALVSGFTEVK